MSLVLAFSNLGYGDLSPIPDSHSSGIQNEYDSMNSAYQETSLFYPRHTRHTSHRSLFHENDRGFVDGMHGLVDDMALRDNVDIEYSDVPRGAGFDNSFYQSRMTTGYNTHDRSSYVNPSSAHSLIGSNGDYNSRRFDTGLYSSSQLQSDYSHLLSEPPPLPENDSFPYSSVSSNSNSLYGNPSLMPEHPQTHCRMYSSPSFNSPSVVLNSSYPHPSPSGRPFNPMYSRQNPEYGYGINNIFVFHFLEDKQMMEIPVAYPEYHSKESSPMVPDGPPKKLPYPCRDFRNGRCTRGENCRFMHYMESRY